MALCSIRRLVGVVANKSAFGELPSGSRWLAPAVALAVRLALMHGAEHPQCSCLALLDGLLQGKPPNATARLLLVSDYTAVSIGARTADVSVTSLIARHHPNEPPRVLRSIAP